jgi:hypothetical protein
MHAELVNASQAVGDAFNLQTRFAEIQEQAELETGCLEVVQALRMVRFLKRPGDLQFDYEPIFNQHVGEILANDDAVVTDPDRVLLGNTQTSLPNFVRQRVLIDLLKESGTQRVEHGKRTANDGPRQSINFILICVHSRGSAYICV